VAQEYVPLDTVVKLPQFYLLWLGIMGNAMAGVAIISCAKTIMGDIFGSQLPMYVVGCSEHTHTHAHTHAHARTHTNTHTHTHTRTHAHTHTHTRARAHTHTHSHAHTHTHVLIRYVDGAFCASYVAGLSVANLGGRLLWASASDKVGRRNTYLTFGAIGVPTLISIPYLTEMASMGTSQVPLWGFVAGSSLLISMYVR
jgi:hypothetical protein